MEGEIEWRRRDAEGVSGRERWSGEEGVLRGREEV